MHFSQSFIDELINKVKEKHTDLDFSEYKQLPQFARFNGDVIDSVYISATSNLTEYKDSQILLKFQKEDKHKNSYIFTHIYIRKTHNGELEDIENRYDTDMNLVSKYHWAENTNEHTVNKYFVTKVDLDKPKLKVNYIYDTTSTIDYTGYLKYMQSKKMIKNVSNYSGQFFRKDGTNNYYLIFGEMEE